MKYSEFVLSKTAKKSACGFFPIWLPDWLIDFQAHLVDWSVRVGRGANFADCGLGKGVMQLVWGENVVRKTNKPVLIAAPLAVSHQFVREGEKFGIEVHRSTNGTLIKGVNVTNYERLSKFDPSRLAGFSGDESGIIKHFDTATRKILAEFCQDIPYRGLATATPAPNDYMELGSSSEVLGVMKRSQMLGMFFTHASDETQKWVLKGHAKRMYWKWVASWARAVRKPSDLGFDDGRFLLPLLRIERIRLPASLEYPGFFADAVGLNAQRKEKRASLECRCSKVAELIPDNRPVVVWCHLNDESELLEKMIPDAVQVTGSQPDEEKEEKLTEFSSGGIRVLVTKPRIGGWGLNWQHCSDVFCFADHSFEAFYQTVRRCYRFGQKREVHVRLVYSSAEERVVDSMLLKQDKSSEMFDGIVAEMRDYQEKSTSSNSNQQKVRVPGWLK